MLMVSATAFSTGIGAAVATWAKAIVVRRRLRAIAVQNQRGSTNVDARYYKECPQQEKVGTGIGELFPLKYILNISLIIPREDSVESKINTFNCVSYKSGVV